MATMTREPTPTLNELLGQEAGLGLPAPELEELLVAVTDREEVAAEPHVRARLARGRAALERELARLLEA